MPADFGAEGEALGGAGGAILAFLLGWSGRARSAAGVGAFGGLLAGGPVLHALALGQALVSCLSTRAWQGIGTAGIGAVGTPVSKSFDFGGGGASNPLVFGKGGIGSTGVGAVAFPNGSLLVISSFAFCATARAAASLGFTLLEVSFGGGGAAAPGLNSSRLTGPTGPGVATASIGFTLSESVVKDLP